MALLSRHFGCRPMLRRRMCSGWWLGAAAIAVCPVVNAQPTTAQSPQQPLEAEVKAVFLYNFAKYVDWPSSPPGQSSTVRMCVPANSQFLPVLREAVRNEIVNGRPLAAVGLDAVEGARDCDILYVGNAATADAATWIASVRGRQVLTVGDGTLVNGLVIAFVRDQNRVRFDIDRHAAAAQQLTISSRLLGLARRVAP